MARISVDVDDTLYSFTALAREKWVEWAIEHGGDKRGAYCAWVEWRSPADVIDLDVWLKIIGMCHDPEIILAQKPYEFASEVLAELVEQGHTLTYISDRSQEAGAATIEWIEKHFPTPQGTRYLMKRMPVKSPHIFDCQYMIDDRPKNVVDFLYDFDWKHRWGSRNVEKQRKAFGLIMEHNRGLTDIPNLYLAPSWRLLREYMIEHGVLNADA